MKSENLYKQLEKDFITPEMSDEWAEQIRPISEFITKKYKERQMGLVCDFSNEIQFAYTAVFPSDRVLKNIIDRNKKNSLLFVHHPATWDIRLAPNVFKPINRELLKKFKELGISIYNLHVPLDNFGEYSTSKCLAEQLGVNNLSPFAPYFGALCGVIGEIDINNCSDLVDRIEKAIGHNAKYYNYGDERIANSKVAIVAGGGNDLEILEEIKKSKVNTFITGISAKNDHSAAAHSFAEKNKINIIGGSHYSTEKFACIKMQDYFKEIGIDSEFIGDLPVIEDE